MDISALAKGRLAYLSALLLGLMSAFAYQPVGLWLLMPFAFMAIFELVVRQHSLKRALLIGWLFGLGQFVLGLNWIATSFTYQAAMPAWLGWVSVLLLSLYLAVYPMLAVAVGWRVGNGRPVQTILALAGAWTLTEWLRASMFTGFSWNPISVSFVDSYLRGMTQLVGSYGLSAILILLAGGAWLLARRRWLAGLATIAAILIIALPFTPTFVPGGGSTAVRIVQPNIGQDVKWDEGMNARALAKLTELSIRGAPERRLLFWPEAALVEPLADERIGADNFVLDQRLMATRALAPGDTLLTGGLGYRSENGRTLSSVTNSIFLLGPLGTLQGRYNKAHLVPYGEYLPMRPLLEAVGLSRLAPGDGDFDEGPGPQTIALPDGLKVGFQICYEIIFSGEVVDRDNRPDLIFNPSNDAWFGRWGPPQHLAQARMRATEENLWVVRSTPTGISALIDPAGRVVASIPWREEGMIDGVIQPGTQPTLFARLGNLAAIFFGLLLVASAIALRARRR